jgi:hypothetical protein
VYLLLGAVLGLAVYLNQVGLPGFIKGPLLGRLRERGLELEFSRLRVRLGRGLVAEHVNVTRAREVAGEQIYADQLQLKLDWAQVVQLRPEVRAFTISGGRVAIPVLASNEFAGSFVVDDIQGRLRFVSDELWELDRLEGTCHGGAFSAAGSITNATLLRRRSEPRRDRGEAWRRVLLTFVREVDASVFAQPPNLALAFHADLKNPEWSTADVRVIAGSTVTRWGQIESLRVDATLNQPPGSNGSFAGTLRVAASRAESDLGYSCGRMLFNAALEIRPDSVLPEFVEYDFGGDEIVSPFGRAARISMSGRSSRTEGDVMPSAAFALPAADRPPMLRPPSAPSIASRVDLTVTGLDTTNRIQAGALRLHVSGRHGTNEWHQIEVRGDVTGADSPWLRTDAAAFRLEATPRETGSALPWDPALALWNIASPFVLRLEARATEAVHPRLHLDDVTLALRWTTNSTVEIDRVETHLHDGMARASAVIDPRTRHVTARAQTLLDLHRLHGLFNEGGRRWLSQYGWESNRPPRLDGEVGVVLPAWTNREPDWRGGVLPTLTVAADVTATNGSFRGIAADTITGRISGTNRVWRVTDMVARRPEGEFRFSYAGDEATRDYHFRVRSDFDPRIARHLLTNKVQKVLDEFAFTAPPHFEGEVWGRWRDHSRSGVRGFLALTNVTFRGEHLDVARGHLDFTNQYVRVRDARLEDGPQTGDMPGFAYDIASGLVSFTNTFSTMGVDRVTRVIGPKTHAMIAPYRFSGPPAVRINGVLGTRGDASRNDIRFDVTTDGGFQWWRLKAAALTGSVHSLGTTLYITNLAAVFHGGGLRGELEFDVGSREATPFRIQTTVTNVDIRSLITDLRDGRTNRIEGRLSGEGRITSGDTRRQATWRGSGRATLADGFLWDTPVFGLASPVLESLSPGLSKTRFTEGSATFLLEDRLIRTRDLQLRSPSMRLDYNGTVSYDGNLDAYMQASMFREVPILGQFATLALSPFEKLFEYRVTGTLSQPKSKPAYIPSFVLAPFRPIETLRSLMISDKPAETNAPAVGAVPVEPPKAAEPPVEPAPGSTLERQP